MKNDKKKRQNIGFVAQDVKEVIPEEFESVINEDNEYMSINYGRMCAILWKSHQEMMVKMEKMEEEIKELKRTPTGSPTVSLKKRQKQKRKPL